MNNNVDQYLYVHCEKCNKDIGRVIYIDEDQILKLSTSRQYCPECGIVHVLVLRNEIVKTPYTLTLEEREYLSSMNVQKLDQDGSAHHKKHAKSQIDYLIDHKKAHQKNIPDSQSSIDDFIQINNKEE